MPKKKTVIGIVSDTHGLLRERVLDEMKGSDLIVHAGDLDAPEVLETLASIAPVVVARGNMDRGDWAAALPACDITEIAGQTIYVIHDLGRLDLEPSAAGIAVVISGHTHQPVIAEQKGVWYINPGSAGPRRFGKPLSVGRLSIQQGRLTPEIIHLD